MLKQLKAYFGFDRFLPFQEEIIAKVLAKHDTLVLMPTGGGKSLCYQLPALRFKGLTLVVSPLIALMKDQVDGLRANGVPAGLLNSTLPTQEASQVQDQARQRKIKILYVAPERLALPGFQRFLQSLDVSLIAIDEAHCISEWGHDFRPDYRNLKALRKSFPGVPVIALTATATPEVRQDILDRLNMREPVVYVSGFARPNLAVNIRAVNSNQDKFARILELAHQHRTGIIYCATRKSVEKVSKRLKEEHLDHITYHGGMDSDTRDQMQDRFIQGGIDLAVATNAFGMGIDRPDIRFIAHFEIPGSVEAYYQEAGRAGRDDQPATCDLLFNYADKRIQEMFLEGSNPPLPVIHALYELLRDKADEQHEIRLSGDDLRQHLGPGTNPMAINTALSILVRNHAIERFDIPGQRLRGTRLLQPQLDAHQLEIDTAALADKAQRDSAKLNAILKFAYSRSCRQQWILDYFGETEARTCGQCNSCNHATTGDYREPAGKDEKNIIRKALSGVARMSWKNNPSHYRARFGKRRIIQMLLGSKQASADWFDASELSTYGILKPEGKTYLDTLFNAMEDAGLVCTEGGEYPLLNLTPEGVEVMHDRATFQLSWPERKLATSKAKSTGPSPTPDLSGKTLDFDPELYEKLKKKRAELAASQGNIPPYRILSNSVLKELTIHRHWASPPFPIDQRYETVLAEG